MKLPRPPPSLLLLDYYHPSFITLPYPTTKKPPPILQAVSLPPPVNHNLIHLYSRLRNLCQSLVFHLNQSESIATANLTVHLSSLITNYTHHLQYLHQYTLNKNNQNDHHPLFSQPGPMPTGKLIQSIVSKNTYLNTLFDDAWTNIIGSVIVDPKLLNKLVSILSQFHTTSLDLCLNLAKLKNEPTQFINPINANTLADMAIESATRWANVTYPDQKCPPILVTVHNSLQPKFNQPCIPGIQKYMHGILVASLSASISSCNLKPTHTPINVFIVNGKEDVCFKISHKGLSLSHRQLAQVFNFGLIAAPKSNKLPLLPFQINKHPSMTPDVPIPRVRFKFLRALLPPSNYPIHPLLLKSATFLFNTLRGKRYTATASPIRPETPLYPESLNPPPAVCRLLQLHAVPLSLARVHAKSLCGDLAIHSMEGFGSETYLHFSTKNNTRLNGCF